MEEKIVSQLMGATRFAWLYIQKTDRLLIEAMHVYKTNLLGKHVEHSSDKTVEVFSYEWSCFWIQNVMLKYIFQQ